MKPGQRLINKYKRHESQAGQKTLLSSGTSRKNSLTVDERIRHANARWELKNDILNGALFWKYEDMVVFSNKQHLIRRRLYNNDIIQQLKHDFPSIKPVDRWPGYNEHTKVKGMRHLVYKSYLSNDELRILIWFIMQNGLLPRQAIEFIYTIIPTSTRQRFYFIKQTIKECTWYPQSRTTFIMR